MIPNHFNAFLTDYVGSLKERTRGEKGGNKFGLDWLIYNYGLLNNLIPIRLPFRRQSGAKIAQSTAGTEFGIDVAFLTPDELTLKIFVLKDEELTNQTWTKHSFGEDLEKAKYPDLSRSELSNVTSVEIILAYNKDEKVEGVQLFENLAKGSNPTIHHPAGREIPLSIVRWNLSKIVDEIASTALDPTILPQHLSGTLVHLSHLVMRVEYGTSGWKNMVVPAWDSYLDEVLSRSEKEGTLQAIPISLIVLKSYLETSTFNQLCGWIELIEWAVVKSWGYFEESDAEGKQIIFGLLAHLYLQELLFYIGEEDKSLDVEHSLSKPRRAFSYINTINDANRAYWLMARIGILSLAIQDCIDTASPAGKQLATDAIPKLGKTLTRLINNNPACYRPLIDLHHIQIFLAWLLFWQTGARDEMFALIHSIATRLLLRRTGSLPIPFPDGWNQIDVVAEYVALGKRPYGYCAESSYLVLMLAELSFSFEPETRDQLLEKIYTRLTLGISPSGEQYVFKPDGSDMRPLDLLWWSPDDNWMKDLFKKKSRNGVAVNLLELSDDESSESLADKFGRFLGSTRRKYPFTVAAHIPKSVIILGCLWNKSPLPSEFWRGVIFPIEESSSEANAQAS